MVFKILLIIKITAIKKKNKKRNVYIDPKAKHRTTKKAKIMKPIESSSSDDDEDDEEETTEEMEVTHKKKNNESPASNLRPTTKQLTVTAKTNSLNKQQKKKIKEKQYERLIGLKGKLNGLLKKNY